MISERTKKKENLLKNTAMNDDDDFEFPEAPPDIVDGDLVVDSEPALPEPPSFDDEFVPQQQQQKIMESQGDENDSSDEFPEPPDLNADETGGAAANKVQTLVDEHDRLLRQARAAEAERPPKIIDSLALRKQAIQVLERAIGLARNDQTRAAKLAAMRDAETAHRLKLKQKVREAARRSKTKTQKEEPSQKKEKEDNKNTGNQQKQKQVQSPDRPLEKSQDDTDSDELDAALFPDAPLSTAQHDIQKEAPNSNDQEEIERCGQCASVIDQSDDAVLVDNQKYHASCLNCAMCNISLDDSVHQLDDGKLVCKTHATTRTLDIGGALSRLPTMARLQSQHAIKMAASRGADGVDPALASPDLDEPDLSSLHVSESELAATHDDEPQRSRSGRLLLKKMSSSLLRKKK